tara:strand:+ start:84 stop:545 length:462 start_codon:yes stop_codon:yes gene_type:complete
MVEGERNYWLLIEHLENWHVDERNGFTFFGLPNRQLKMANRVKIGDLLLFYIADGVSSIADVREAVENGTHDIDWNIGYDEPYRICVRTRPHISLEQGNWLPIKDYLPHLSLTKEAFRKNPKRWGYIFQHSMRKLGKEDGCFLVDELRKRSEL